MMMMSSSSGVSRRVIVTVRDLDGWEEGMDGGLL